MATLLTIGLTQASAGDRRRLRKAEVVSALSYALDLTEGQTAGHAVRSCLLGMRLAQAVGMPQSERDELYYALLLKDAGCSSNASRLFNIIRTDDLQAKRDLKTSDWTKMGWESLMYALDHVRTGRPFMERARALLDVSIRNRSIKREMVQIRCERGASIARKIGVSEAAADGIRSLDEHWDGRGHAEGLGETDIPLFSRLMNMAQTIDVFNTEYGRTEAIDILKKRSGKWFDPALVRAALSVSKADAFWADLDGANASRAVLALEPDGGELGADEATLDDICEAFAEVIDAKTPFTYRHSTGVAETAVSIAAELGLSAGETSLIRRAALLHDIGKLSVSNTILEKPGSLDRAEWETVHKHPYYTQQILERIPGFERLTDIAASHHEKLDGSGYFRQLSASQLSTPARILAVADVYDALSARRPYRDALPRDTVFGMMHKDAPHALDISCLEALEFTQIC